MPPPQPQVVIVDDQPTFRQAARHLLAARGYEVVAEAGCAQGAAAAVERHAPHGVLMDVRLGDDDGFAVCSTLTRDYPGLAVVLASDADYEDHEQLARCGARGFVPKARLHDTDLARYWPRA
jgi:DNA-binding NarL/FixJ family response regulator